MFALAFARDRLTGVLHYAKDLFEHDRMERAETAFHERVARAFERFSTSEWQTAHPECGPIILVDGVGGQEVVFGRVLASLRERWPEIFPS